MGILQLTLLEFCVMCYGVNPLVRQVENLFHGLCSPPMGYTAAEMPFHAVVISIARKHSETNIRIEFFETEGGVRASSLVCLLGVGIGVSSYLLYRFWHKIFPPGTPRLPPRVVSQRRKKSRPNTPTSLAEDGCRTLGHSHHQVFLNSPDSGCQTMGNTDSNANSTTITPSTPSSIDYHDVSGEEPHKEQLQSSKQEDSIELQGGEAISETEYESFVVISQAKDEAVSSKGSDGSAAKSESTTTASSQNVTIQSMCEEKTAAPENVIPSHVLCRETVASSLLQGKKVDEEDNVGGQTVVKEEEEEDSLKISEANLTTGQMYGSMMSSSNMQGSIMSTASTDLGFVSGNYDQSRETSQEPGQYSLESFNPSFQLNLDCNSNPAEGEEQGERAARVSGKSARRRLQKLQTVQDLSSPKVDYSLSEFLNHPTHLSDGSVLYSFLEDSAATTTSHHHHGDNSVARHQSDMLVTPPQMRAMSDGGGTQSEPDTSCFREAPVKHSTPQFENADEEVFKNAMKAPTKKHTFPHRMKKTQSFTSEMSTTSSNASYYLWGGHSVDMGENFSGRSTPDIDILKSGDLLGCQTEMNINEIQNQILGLRADIDEMSERVQTLSSQDNLSYLPEIDGVGDVIRGSRMPKLSQVRKRYVSQLSNDSSSLHSLSFSEDGGAELRRSTSQNQGDFMWDYQSDLASGFHQNFVARRPVVGDIVEKESPQENQESPVPEHMKKYLQQQSDSVNLPNDSRNISDLYIDDGFSFHQSYFPARQRVPVAHVGVMATGVLSPVVEHQDAMGGRSQEDTAADGATEKNTSEKLCSQCQSHCCTNCGKFLKNNNNSNNTGKTSSAESETKTNSTQTEIRGESSALHNSDDSLCSSSNTKCNNTATKQRESCYLCSHPQHRHQPTATYNSHHQHHHHCGFVNCCAETPQHQTHHCTDQGSSPLSTRTHQDTGIMASCGLSSKNPCEYMVSPAAHLCHTPNISAAADSTSSLVSPQPRGHPISVSTPATCCHGNPSTTCMSQCGCRVHGSQVTACSHHPQNRMCHHHQALTSSSSSSFRSDTVDSKFDSSFLDYSVLSHTKSSVVDEVDSAIESAVISHQSASGTQFCTAAGSTFSPAKRVVDQTVEDCETLNNNIIVVNNTTTASDGLQSTSPPHNKLQKQHWEVTNIGTKHRISDYMQREWKGATATAEVMRKGYEQIPSILGLSGLRVIRGDNYCALRSTLYQVLVNCLPVRNHLGSLEYVLGKLDLFKSEQHSYLHNWTFANRLPHDKTQVYETAKECVQMLFDQLQICSNLENSTDRERHLIDSLNSNPELDLQILEAVKCLMMVNAVKLYQKSQNGGDVPVFVWLMFARDTSETPQQFLRNHLNLVGDSGGLEQVEMFLLGYTLGVRITVVRPSQFSKEDYITHFPSEGADGYPRVHLVAEDDRHYNALV